MSAVGSRRSFGWFGLIVLFGWGVSEVVAAPGDVAPGAPELQEAEQRLQIVQVDARGIGLATQRLQVAWTRLPATKATCEPAHVELGWRIERFGAAWRETTQAVKAASSRLRDVRAAPTAAPLLDDTWSTSLNALLSQSEAIEQAFLEASAWQVAFVRPTLAPCELNVLAAAPGFGSLEVPVRGVARLPTAVLAVPEGRVCPGDIPTDGGVVLVESGLACWTAAPSCGCEPLPVEPGAVLGPPPPEPEVVVEPEVKAPEAKQPAAKKKSKKKVTSEAAGPGM